MAQEHSKLSKRQELTELRKRINSGYNNTFWNDLFRNVRQLEKGFPTDLNENHVQCPICPEGDEFFSIVQTAKQLKNHIETLHFSNHLAHKPTSAAIKRLYSQLKDDAKHEQMIEEHLLLHNNFNDEIQMPDESVNNAEFYHDFSGDSSDAEFEQNELEENYVYTVDDDDFASDDLFEKSDLESKSKVELLLNNPIAKSLMDSLHEISEKVSKADLNNLASNIIRFATEIFPNAADRFKTPEQLDMLKRLAQSTHYKEQYRKRTLKKYLNLPEIVPLEYNGEELGRYSLINIEKLCRKYLLNKSIRDHLNNEMKEKRKTNGVYRSQMDGWFSDRFRGWLKLEIFLDDAQLGPSNGFGSGCGQKYIMVYITFPDLPFHLRTQIDQIELLMMVKRSDLNAIPKEDRFATLLSKLNVELDRLGREGIEIGGQKYYVTVSTVLGDNLGVYEFLGFATNFQTTCFRCRYCGLLGKIKGNSEDEGDGNGDGETEPPKKKKKKKKQKKNENENREMTCQDIKTFNSIPKLLTDADLEKLSAESLAKFIRYGYPFSNVSTLSNHSTNLSPPDIMHDLPEGILEIILESLLVELRKIIDMNRAKLPTSIRKKHLGGAVTLAKCFLNYSFYEGSPKLKWINSTTVKIDGKGILKLEAFLKFEAIVGPQLFSLLDPSMQKYYLDAKEFTLLAFSTEFTEADLNKMKSLAFLIHDRYRQFRDIHCKVHHILHYADLVRKFGPLYLYCTWRYERKHQYSKHVARIMRNFLNPPLTIHQRHQFKRAAFEADNQFFETNFFPDILKYRLMDKDDEKLPKGVYSELPSTERPFSLKKGILRKCLAHPKFWIQPKFAYRAPDGSIIIQGPVYTKKNCPYNKTCGWKNAVLEKSHARRFIDIRGLHHSNDFVGIEEDNESSDEPKYYLIRWIM